METKITKDGSKLLIHISGSLNTQTAPDLENSLSRYDKDSITDYVFDFSELDYISSSGLRILLNLTKKVMGKGKVVIQKPNEDVKNVFAMTGFDSFLELE